MREDKRQSKECLRREKSMTGKIGEVYGKELELLQELYEAGNYRLLGIMANGFLDLRSRGLEYMKQLPEWEQD